MKGGYEDTKPQTNFRSLHGDGTQSEGHQWLHSMHPESPLSTRRGQGTHPGGTSTGRRDCYHRVDLTED